MNAEQEARLFKEIGSIGATVKGIEAEVGRRFAALEESRTVHSHRISSVEKSIAQVWIVGPVVLGCVTAAGVVWAWVKG